MEIPNYIMVAAPPTTTINRILPTVEFKGDKKLLALCLGVSVKKVTRYLEDVNGEDHAVRMYGGKLQILTLAK